MAVLARRRTEKYFGLRPMDPLKDLRGVADLVEEAFANDLDRSGQNALQELRWLSRLKPILWWMVYASPDHTDFLSGFVWEEDDKIVGNIMILSKKPELVKELQSKKETTELRIKTLETQESKTRENAAATQKEVLEAMKNDDKNGNQKNK